MVMALRMNGIRWDRHITYTRRGAGKEEGRGEEGKRVYGLEGAYIHNWQDGSVVAET